MSNYIGIDFGMQNIKVCVYDGRQYHKADLEGNQQSESKMSKNAVYYAENEEGILMKYFFSAQQAENARTWSDEDYVCYIKRELQKEKYKRSFCNGKYSFSAVQIICDIFKQIYVKLEESRYDISAPVILTVPVLFSEAQKMTLKHCAEAAGFRVQEIITESFAALFSEEIFEECIESDEDETYIVLFDFGASSLDMCLFRVENDETMSIETIASSGISYGGKDITDEVTSFLMKKNEDIVNHVVAEGRLDDASAPVQMFECAESLKNALYEEEDIAEVEDWFYGNKLVLKRSNIDKILDSNKIWNKIEKTISDMFDSTDEFDHNDYSIVSKVVMTGGTSKIQYFRDKLINLFEDAELIGEVDNVNTTYCSVSSGAVAYAIRSDEVDVINSVPMNIGIEVNNGFERALGRNTCYERPGKRKQLSYQWLEKHNWRINVYQSLDEVREHSDINGEDILYSGFFKLNKDAYSEAGDDIVLQIKYTTSGIVASTASTKNLNEPIEKDLIINVEVSA